MDNLGISNEVDFCDLMDEIDTQLRDDEVPIHARPIRGLILVSERYGLNLPFSSEINEPRAGVYSGQDLTLRVTNWFSDRYGDQIKTNFGPGQTIVNIKGDIYRVTLPRVYGKVEFVADPASHGRDVYSNITTAGVSATLNVLDSIVDLQPAFSRVLSSTELDELVCEIGSVTEKFQAIERITEFSVGREGYGDLITSVERFFLSPPQYGLSLYDSLQAAEKFLKAYLLTKGIQFPRGHDGHNLSRLTQLVSEHSGVLFPQEVVDRVQCGSQVRYGEVQSSKSEAFEAHRGTIEICWQCANAIL